ncbi:MAG: type-F conjugative transfer system pilin assembly protein TrbC [Nitrospirota bacterium]
MQVIIFYGCFLEKGLVVLFKIFIVFITLALFFDTGVTYAELKKAYIETPSPCYKVEKIEGKRVYLESTSKDCVKTIGKVQIEVGESVKNVYVFTDGKFWKEQTLTEFNLDSINEYMEGVEKLKKELKVPENLHKKQGQEIAKKTYQYYQSKEFQEKLQAETERLKEGIFKKPVEEYYSGSSKEIGKTKGKLLPTERIYIFISSSVPMPTLRNYALSLDRLGDPNIVMVMRGFVDGMKYIKPTIRFVSDILKKDPSCDMTKQKCDTHRLDFQIDPLLFRRYQIAKVPAVVYATGLNVMDVQMSEGLESNTEVSNYYVLYGDASFEYVLDTIHKETKSKSIERLLTTLRKDFY